MHDADAIPNFGKLHRLISNFTNLYFNIQVMIYITQLIYLLPGQQEVFDQFEAIAIPIIGKYNGRLLLRVRPGAGDYLQCEGEPPYEIHLVQFEAEQDFENFKNDEERKKFLHFKEQSIKASVLFQGVRV